MKTQKNNYEYLFHQALRIRLVEEKIIELYPSDKIQSPVHLSIGQEAIAVGLCNNLNKNDWVFINYRGHAFYLAKGGLMPQLFAELFGKIGGNSKGKGGSMHLADPVNGIMGASAVVASTISHALGAALASKIRGEKRVFIANFGDGATEQGVYHESLNFASLHSLPVLFLCENNQLAVHTSLETRQAYKINDHAKSYGITSMNVEDGYNIIGLNDVFSEVVNKIRIESRPYLIEVQTRRYNEHVGPGEDFDAGYRSVKDIDMWKSNDCLLMDKKLINKFSPFIQNEIEEAVKFAEASSLPLIDELLTDVK